MSASMVQRSPLTVTFCSVLLVMTTCPITWAADDDVDAVTQAQKEIDEVGQKTQKRINELSEQAQDMLADYRAARDETANLRVYNEQLQRQVESQREELKSLDRQLARIDRTQEEFVPSMLEALDALKRFVKRDIPFRADERRARVEELDALMGRADVTTAEKYRQLMSAFKKELEYGRTIDTYRGKLELDGEQRSVRFLRIGRIALMYQTLDQQRTGRWNPGENDWESVDGAFRAAFEKGYRIAAEQAPPDLVKTPVNAPGGD